MSKNIQIRNVPDEVHRTLRVRAAAAGRSLSDYLLGELERVADHPSVADVLARASRRSAGVAASDVVDAIRAGRGE